MRFEYYEVVGGGGDWGIIYQINFVKITLIKYLKPLLVILSIVISLWLLFDIFNDIDIAQTKNNYLTRLQVRKIIESNNIDSVEVRLFEHFSKTRQIRSDVALSRVKLISIFVVFQFLLLILILRKR